MENMQENPTEKKESIFSKNKEMKKKREIEKKETKRKNWWRKRKGINM